MGTCQSWDGPLRLGASHSCIVCVIGLMDEVDGEYIQEEGFHIVTVLDIL